MKNKKEIWSALTRLLKGGKKWKVIYCHSNINFHFQKVRVWLKNLDNILVKKHLIDTNAFFDWHLKAKLKFFEKIFPVNHISLKFYDLYNKVLTSYNTQAIRIFWTSLDWKIVLFFVCCVWSSIKAIFKDLCNNLCFLYFMLFTVIYQKILINYTSFGVIYMYYTHT